MRKRFTAATEYPVASRSRGTARNRGSEKPCDTKKTKRVRFDDAEMDSFLDHGSVRERKIIRSPKSYGPKTSEYAYFRNIKNSAVHGRPRSYNKDNGQLKNSKTNQHEDMEPADILKPSSRDLRFSDCRETACHFDHRLLLTPPVTKYEEPSQGDIKDLTKNIRERPLLLVENVTPVGRVSSLPIREASENTSLSGDLTPLSRCPLKSISCVLPFLGNQCSKRSIFSAKRHRLRQWAHNSVSEVEKLHPEGVSLISSLLSRLYPKCNESDLFCIHDSSKGETGKGCKAPILRESKNLEERLQLSNKREWNDTELPKIWFSGYRDRVFLEQDAYFSGSPFSNYCTETHFEDELTDLHYSSKDHKSSSLHAEHELSFCLPLERYGYLGSSYLKELDGSCCPIKCRRKEPHKFLLKWDFEREKDGVSSSIINYDPAKIYSPGLSTAWNANHQQIVDHVPDAKALCSPSLFPNYYLEYNSIRSYPSTSYFTPDLVPNFDEAKCSMPETDMLPPTFPSTTKCITLAEDTNAEYIPCSSDMIFSYGDQLWLKNKAWGEPHSDFWQKGFQGADVSPQNPSIFHAWKFPPIDHGLCSFSILKEAPRESFTLCSEGAIHNHSWFLNFPSSLDSTINGPLLLNNVSNDWSDREVYFDDDNKWNYS